VNPVFAAARALEASPVFELVQALEASPVFAAARALEASPVFELVQALEASPVFAWARLWPEHDEPPARRPPTKEPPAPVIVEAPASSADVQAAWSPDVRFLVRTLGEPMARELVAGAGGVRVYIPAKWQPAREGREPHLWCAAVPKAAWPFVAARFARRFVTLPKTAFVAPKKVKVLELIALGTFTTRAIALEAHVTARYVRRLKAGFN
jgi:hypothetical protein